MTLHWNKTIIEIPVENATVLSFWHFLMFREMYQYYLVRIAHPCTGGSTVEASTKLCPIEQISSWVCSEVTEDWLLGGTEHLEGHKYLEGHRKEGEVCGDIKEVLSLLGHCVVCSAFYLYILYYLLAATLSRFWWTKMCSADFTNPMCPSWLS